MTLTVTDLGLESGPYEINSLSIITVIITVIMVPYVSMLVAFWLLIVNIKCAAWSSMGLITPQPHVLDGRGAPPRA